MTADERQQVHRLVTVSSQTPGGTITVCMKSLSPPVYPRKRLQTRRKAHPNPCRRRPQRSLQRLPLHLRRTARRRMPAMVPCPARGHRQGMGGWDPSPDDLLPHRVLRRVLPVASRGSSVMPSWPGSWRESSPLLWSGCPSLWRLVLPPRHGSPPRLVASLPAPEGSLRTTGGSSVAVVPLGETRELWVWLGRSPPWEQTASP